MTVECVRLLRLPGDHRALVSAETAELGERMGEFKRLDAAPDVRQPMRWSPSKSLGGSVVNVQHYYAE